MKEMWKSDPCYASYGVDGSECSFVMYLSEVEGWCPKKAWRGKVEPPKEDPSKVTYANATADLEKLMKILVDPNERQGYAWIRMRIRRMWSRWSSAITRLSQNQDLRGRRKKKILVHLGLLSRQSGWKFAENQFKGGPLGELVQWSDLICTLFILGHEITITSETEQLASCLLRIVDSFGTEPAYNNRVYAKSHKILTSWGGQDLQPQQFFTMFPHSPDNSFMGFVVEQHLNDTISKEIKRKNQAVVYGKNEYMWEGKMDYLNVVKEFVEVHATVYTDKKVKSNVTIPAYVKNHGLLNGEDLHTLLRQSKLFIGLGFPYEGPAPLEAIANGAVFINPKFIPPHNSKNTKFFKGKPTLRELTSQQPYAEQFIGEPHVYTININDLQQVKETIKKILTKDSVNLICEPSHFREVNSVTVLKQKGATCNRERTQTDIYYPALDVDNKDCIIQHEEMLYSCVGAKINLRRLCPCRNYVKGQTALCQGCER
ncbi:hypothetical protein KUTeg_002019 [Tegillarca granosa]|uniref:alpha-1,6-mannosyl-glycoprotein 6-beta-N-acetylglucosaminyltransferase n=1 Tax=Tegillarca granosa TaxID=220873 RepID=A0ABQ9FUK5_TEGGR|nr:hypothetical protein KUTeg_002019 [Tegillarca granosa]